MKLEKIDGLYPRKKYLDKICDFIKSRGGEAISFVDSNTLPERYIAYLANIGFIGRNNMIIIIKVFHYFNFFFNIFNNMQIIVARILS